MEILELFLPIIKDLFIIFVVAVVIPGIGAAVKWWKNLAIENWVKELVIDGVLFTQEKYWQSSGKEKFQVALEWITQRLNEKGINVDKKWLEGLIDATVKLLRDEFDDWYREEE